jgi:hypothetical protein
VAYSGGNNQFPSAIDIAIVLALLTAVIGLQLFPAIQMFQQDNKAVTYSGQNGILVVIIEIVLDTPPTQDVTINNYHAVYQYHDGEGYHLVFVVPKNKTYILSPVCCTRSRYLSPGKHYAFWLGGCVAIRTDK